jgi:hypothetical protein
MRGLRREFFLCNLCALRALCGLTLFKSSFAICRMAKTSVKKIFAAREEKNG